MASGLQALIDKQPAAGASPLTDGQRDFTGGMNDRLTPAANQYSYARNVELRRGYPETRRGIHVAYPRNTSGLSVGITFGSGSPIAQDLYFGSGDPLAEDLYFGTTIYNATIQCAIFCKASFWPHAKLLMVADGVPQLVDDGVSLAIDTEDTIASTETIRILQADDRVFIFRGATEPPLVWDMTLVTGFVVAPGAPGAGDDIPYARGAAYFLGRLWAYYGEDDVAASNILDPFTWDLTLENFQPGRGDGDQVQALIPISGDSLIAAKRRSMWLLSGCSGSDLANSVGVQSITANLGICGPDAWTRVGDDVWFLSNPGGIYSIQRNPYNVVQSKDTAVSAPIQSVVRRINWLYAHTSIATTFDNYVIFGVPLDQSTRPNHMLVYDLLLGCWIGTWDSPFARPVNWLPDTDRLCFLNGDGTVKELLTATDRDALDPMTEAEPYLSGRRYSEGDLVYASQALWRATGVTTTFTVGSDTVTYAVPGVDAIWELVTDTDTASAIGFELLSRPYDFGDDAVSKRIQGLHIDIQHVEPRVSVEVESAVVTETTQVHAAVEFSETGHEVVQAAWDTTNTNLDYGNSNRQDYPAKLNADFYMGAAGIGLYTMAQHTLKSIPSLFRNEAVRVRLTNDSGIVRVRNIYLQGVAVQKRWSTQ